MNPYKQERIRHRSYVTIDDVRGMRAFAATFCAIVFGCLFLLWVA